MLNTLKLILALVTAFAFGKNASCSLSTTANSAEDNFKLAGGQVREFNALMIQTGNRKEV